MTENSAQRQPACRARHQASRQPSGVVASSSLLAVAASWSPPWFLDAYTVNILIRAFFVATVALTVDVLWGYTGISPSASPPSSGSAPMRWPSCFDRYGFGPGQALLALVGAGGRWRLWSRPLSAGCRSTPGSTPLYASVVSLVLPIVLVQLIYSGGNFTGSSSGLVGFESFDLSAGGLVPDLAGLGVVAIGHRLRMIAIVERCRASPEALRDNEMRCAYLGIDTPRIRIALLVVCGHRRGAGRLRLCRLRRHRGAGECELHLRHATRHHGRARRPRHAGRRRRRRADPGTRKRLPVRQPALRLGADRRPRLHPGHRGLAGRPVRQSSQDGRQRSRENRWTRGGAANPAAVSRSSAR